ncbi:hypothetical protein RchiOBHm_Chr4g0438851 [Rosa chinensis]|uniref:Uncharacterized protein n=1 Tax=Rosa chinensis TaxID=74649 RepID=A0A2P6R2P5_ROSCH|nr:uncharacterized protein LOC112201009 [Rosa chinensis]PRQ40694.1 hypothetical protein RchiOBHm_Chr4g0438851 [Rosa chinensis]
MVSSSISALSHSFSHVSCTNLDVCEKPGNPLKKLVQIKRRGTVCSSSSDQGSSSLQSRRGVLHSSVALAASAAVLFWSSPARAGFLSGSTGIESIPGPELPKVEFLDRFNEENQKKYAENDARFKSSPLLQGLLEKSKLNKEKNSRETQDKYCLRGAEWGVGDCSAEGMKPGERDKFIAMLKERAGVKD